MHITSTQKWLDQSLGLFGQDQVGIPVDGEGRNGSVTQVLSEDEIFGWQSAVTVVAWLHTFFQSVIGPSHGLSLFVKDQLGALGTAAGNSGEDPVWIGAAFVVVTYSWEINVQTNTQPHSSWVFTLGLEDLVDQLGCLLGHNGGLQQVVVQI